MAPRPKSAAPEWRGYIAAFDAYISAKQHGDDEHARQARLLMTYFMEELIPLARRRKPGATSADHSAIEAMLSQIGLMDEEED